MRDDAVVTLEKELRGGPFQPSVSKGTLSAN